ncbi:MAG: GFA family protein [Cyanobacteria bacterium J06635_15]
MSEYTGGCLCGNIRYTITGEAVFPHFCSCHMCQRWSGAPAVAWVDFKREHLVFNGPGGNPSLYRTCETTQRGFCPICSSGICALDDDSEDVSIAVGSLDDPDFIVPESQSFPESAPVWLSLNAIATENS